MIRRLEIPTACSFLLLVSLAGGACDTGPNREGASGWYRKHKRTIDAVDEELRQAIGTMRAFQEEFRCQPTRSERPASDGAEHVEELRKQLKPMLDDLDCTQQETRWLERHDQKVAEFNKEALPGFLEQPGVLGVQISYFKPGDTTWYGLGNIGSYAGGIHDERLKGPDTLEIDGRRIGWGRFQTAYQRSGGKRYGDGKQRDGILVSWKFASGDKTEFVVAMVILADHQTTAEWRAGWM